jgi:hypothetical protein
VLYIEIINKLTTPDHGNQERRRITVKPQTTEIKEGGELPSKPKKQKPRKPPPKKKGFRPVVRSTSYGHGK